MRRSILVAISAFAVLGFTLVSGPAQADTIKLPPDPFIGIRGGEGSFSATDATPRALVPCTEFDQLDLGGFSCAAFHIDPADPAWFNDSEEDPGVLMSIGMIWFGLDGMGIQNTTEGPSCNVDEEVVSNDNFCPDLLGRSDFNGIEMGGTAGEEETRFTDYLVTLYFNPFFDDSPLEFGEDGLLHFLLFIDIPDGGWVSAQELNGFRNANADEFPGNEPVPEPATMLLLGTGMLGAALRGRLKRRR